MVGAAAATAATVLVSPAATMKLLIDTKAKRVLYAEAGKEVVDFFFGLLALPVGTVAKLLRQDGAHAAGAANIYDSAEEMDPAYMRSSAVQDALLNAHRYTLLHHPTIRIPHPPSPTTTVPTFVQGTPPSYAPPSTTYTRGYGGAPASVTVARGCSSCGAAGGGSTGGFVQGSVTYKIMDDLTIAPMSSISVTALLSKLVREDKDLVLEEKLVKIGSQEGLDILKASVQSNTVLTDVFLPKNTADVSTSKNKKARTSSGEKKIVQEKNDKIPDYYL